MIAELPQKLQANIEVLPGGCWRWCACLTAYGYGTVRFDGAQRQAHRVTYALLVGDPGDTLHHECENKWCVNPDHLRPIGRGENVLLGSSPAAVNARKTHCVRGHPLAGENVYHPPKNPTRRDCRRCKDIARAKWRARAAVAA